MNIPFRFYIAQIFHLQNKRLGPFLTEIGLSSGQPKVLDYVFNHEGCTQKEIAGGCGVEAATMSGLVNGLVKKNYVVKKSHEENKREWRIYLTEEGQIKYQEILENIKKIETQTLSEFTEEEQQVFLSLLDRYHQSLKSSLEDLLK